MVVCISSCSRYTKYYLFLFGSVMVRQDYFTYCEQSVIKWAKKQQYCRFGNFCKIFISRIFISRLIGEFLNLRASIQFIKIKLSKIVVFNISENFEFARQ